MPTEAIAQSRVRQIIYLTVIVLLGWVLFAELKTFIPALLAAITLYVLMRKPLFYLTEKRKWGKTRTTLLLMFISFLVIMLPVGLLINMLSSKISYMISHSNELTAAVTKLIADIEKRLHIDLVNENNLDDLGKKVAQFAPSILGATVNSLTTVVFMYFILYFMLKGGRNMEESLYDYIPLKNSNLVKVGNEVNSMVLANSIGIPVIAIAQGVLGLIGYLIFRVPDPLFWFGITCIAAMIPVVGAALAYVPIGLIFLANQQYWQGIAMLVYGFGIIGSADNILRFTLLKKFGDVHPLVTIFGVIVGVNLFGFIGLVFGPLLISLFVLLLRIYSNEFITKNRNTAHIMEN